MAFFRPSPLSLEARTLVVKGFDDLEMPALADDGVRFVSRSVCRGGGKVTARLEGKRGHDGAARFMLLTAARREEVVGAVWAEIDSGEGDMDNSCVATERHASAIAAARGGGGVRSPSCLSQQARALLETLLGRATRLILSFSAGAEPSWRTGHDGAPNLRKRSASSSGDPARVSAWRNDGYIGGRSWLRAACHFGNAGDIAGSWRADRRLQQEPVYP